MSRTRHPRKRRTANPVVPRMKHVAKTYGDYVTMATFGAWTEATGDHGLREHVAKIFHNDEANNAKRSLEGLPRLLTEWQAVPDTRFDRYLPWVAREFNRIFKPYKRMAKRKGLPPFPEGFHAATGRWTITPGGIDHADYSDLEDMARDTRTLRDRFRAIVDWAEAENADINKFDWQQAGMEAERWGFEQEGKVDVEQGAVVYQFDDGWTIQELTTDEQLGDEGDVMQHCVGTYFEDVDAGLTRIFSLRDPKGQPHATLEWDVKQGAVAQLKGKQNAAPVREYLIRMVPFRRAYLDQLARVRRAKQYDTTGLDIFREDLLGVWVYNPQGTLQDKIGGYGALEEAMKQDVEYAVYEWDGTWDAYQIDVIRQALLDGQENLYRSWEPPDLPDDWTEEQRLEAEQEMMDQAVTEYYSGAFVRGGRGRRALAESEEVPGVEWAIYNQTGHFPAESYDEMVEALENEGIQSVPGDAKPPPGRVVAPKLARKNPSLTRGRRPKQTDAGLEALKRKLMR